jgi:hypothetical protein
MKLIAAKLVKFSLGCLCFIIIITKLVDAKLVNFPFAVGVLRRLVTLFYNISFEI